MATSPDPAARLTPYRDKRSYALVLTRPQRDWLEELVVTRLAELERAREARASVGHAWTDAAARAERDERGKARGVLERLAAAERV